MGQRYLIALGSNQRHVRLGSPEQVLVAALLDLNRKGLKLMASAKTIRSAPLGPSRRRYANSVALVKSKLDPPELLARLKHIEAKFGRRRGGQRCHDPQRAARPVAPPLCQQRGAGEK